MQELMTDKRQFSKGTLQGVFCFGFSFLPNFHQGQGRPWPWPASRILTLAPLLSQQASGIGEAAAHAASNSDPTLSDKEAIQKGSVKRRVSWWVCGGVKGDTSLDLMMMMMMMRMRMRMRMRMSQDFGICNNQTGHIVDGQFPAPVCKRWKLDVCNLLEDSAYQETGISSVNMWVSRRSM